MKVLKKTFLTLVLAVPLNLVSATDLVTIVEPSDSARRDDNHTRDIKEVLSITPMTFADVVVVAPELGNPVVVEDNSTKHLTNVNDDDFSEIPEVASVIDPPQ